MSSRRLKLGSGSYKPYEGPAGGYGSLRSVSEIVLREKVLVKGSLAMLRQNKPGGFMCVSCAWAKPAKPHPAEFCENGAKATAWEITPKRTDQAFFEQHTLTELEAWSDHALEAAGRLTHPVRWDPDSDRYRPVSWEIAFQEIARELQACAPEEAVFYTSGRASLETSYMFQLFARIYGSNHLPDSSNMCHESSSVALPQSIGSSVGTVALSDFERCDCIFFIAQNVGTAAPRMMHQLQEAAQRGVRMITLNPMRERGLERFTNPQSPAEMLTLQETSLTTQYLQVKVGGDIAAMFGICKALIELDDSARLQSLPADAAPKDPNDAGAVAFAASMAAKPDRHVLDHAFIAEHTHGFDSFAAATRAHDWTELERVSGLSREQMSAAANTYATSPATMGIYGMGLTQHTMGVQNVHMLCNMLLLRGNIGKPGAGICAVRGHSNVQGQRTVGITEKPHLVPLDTLAQQYHFEPPRWEGYSTVDACQAMVQGNVRAIVALGGNLLRAVPETAAVEAAWRKLRLSVQVATKLNRSHVVHGQIAYLLPCLGRIEIDRQAGGPQAVAVESSVAMFHGSRGVVEPAGPDLRSEPWIVAAMAKATLDGRGRVPWDDWVGDYARVRDAIEATYPAIFTRFNARLFEPGGFARPVPARERRWNTPNGKANFITPARLFAGLEVAPGNTGDIAAVLQLTTVRSNDQFNTTIYGNEDRFRGVSGTRKVVFMNADDVRRLGLHAGQAVDLQTAVNDGVIRTVQGLHIVPYDIPAGCAAAYFPECNPLMPLWHHDPVSKVPGYKAVPVRVVASGATSVAGRGEEPVAGESLQSPI